MTDSSSASGREELKKGDQGKKENHRIALQQRLEKTTDAKEKKLIEQQLEQLAGDLERQIDDIDSYLF